MAGMSDRLPEGASRWCPRSWVLILFFASGLLSLEGCGGRPITGWSSYSVPGWGRGHTAAWTAPGAPIWVIEEHHVFRVDGDSIEEDSQAIGFAPYVPFDPSFHAISGTAPDDIRIDSVLHFDGRSWRWDLDSGGGGQALHGVAHDLYFFLKRDGHGFVQWDGVQWTPHQLPNPPAANWGVAAVHASGPGDVHIVGWGGQLAHYDGSEWRLTTAPFPVELATVWAKSPTEAYAGGARPPISGRWAQDLPPNPGVLLGWDGHGWQELASPTTDAIQHLVGDGDRLFLASGQKVFERSPQGRWTEILEVEPDRLITHVSFGAGMLMVCDIDTTDQNYQEGSNLWVRR